MSSATERELEALIVEQPDDPAAYLVYADWLQDRGEPRGRWIAAQAARLERPDDPDLAAAEAALLDEHRDALIGPIGAHQPPPVFEWYLGFWRALRIHGLGATEPAAAAAEVGALLALPAARFLRELILHGAADAAVIEEIAARGDTLTSLEIQVPVEREITDGTLDALRGWPRLAELSLSACQAVTPVGLGALRELPALAQLELRNHALADAGARQLEGLPGLADVRFDEVAGLTATGMRALAGLPLVSLALGADALDDRCVEPLAHHRSLASLELPGAQITTRGAAAIASIPQLRRLRLSSSGVGDAGVRELAALAERAPGHGLRSLGLGHCETLTAAACEAIGRLTELSFLDLSANAIDGTGLPHLSRLSRLTTLDLGFLELGDRDLPALAGLTELTSLSLAFSRGITDEAVEVLARLPRLRRLDLAATAITPRGIDRLAELPHLHTIGLQHCAPEVREHAWTFDRWYVETRDTLWLEDAA